MGGWIALKLALDHPELIDRVVVYDSAGTALRRCSDPRKLFEPQTTDDVQRLFSMMEPDAKPIPDVCSPRSSARDPELSVDHRSQPELHDTRTICSNASLPSLTEPLLIVWGADDHLIPLSVGQQMHQLVPSSELDILAGCGHLAPNRCSARAASGDSRLSQGQSGAVGQRAHAAVDALKASSVVSR